MAKESVEGRDLEFGYVAEWPILKILERFGSGILIGFGAGMALKSFDLGVYWIKQKRQKRYIHKLLTDGRETVYNSIPNSVLDIDTTRWIIFKFLRTEVLSALRERCTCMTYDQIQDVRLAFQNMEMLERLVETTTKPPKLKHYLPFFHMLENIPWLKLVPKDHPEGTEE